MSVKATKITTILRNMRDHKVIIIKCKILHNLSKNSCKLFLLYLQNK